MRTNVNSTKTTPTFINSQSQPPFKFPKNMDKKDLVAAAKFSDSGMDMSYIYKIDMKSMTGRRPTGTAATGGSVSLRNSGSDDSISRTEVVSIVSSDDCTSDRMLDFIHPMTKDESPTIQTSFDEDDVPLSFSASPHYNHHRHHAHQHTNKESSSRFLSSEPSLTHSPVSLLNLPMDTRSKSFASSNTVTSCTTSSNFHGSGHFGNKLPTRHLTATDLSAPDLTKKTNNVKIRRAARVAARVTASKDSLESGSRLLRPLTGM